MNRKSVKLVQGVDIDDLLAALDYEGVTPAEAARLTGLSYSTVWRRMGGRGTAPFQSSLSRNDLLEVARSVGDPDVMDLH